MGLSTIWKHVNSDLFNVNIPPLRENTKAWVDILTYVFPSMGSPVAMKEALKNLNDRLVHAQLSPIYVLEECRISVPKGDMFLKRKSQFLQTIVDCLTESWKTLDCPLLSLLSKPRSWLFGTNEANWKTTTQSSFPKIQTS
jgi:hypothetical protein